MIKLIDLLKISGVYLNSYKIHCAAGKDDSPLEAFFEGRFKSWQEHQSQQNFRCDEIISLIHLQDMSLIRQQRKVARLALML